MDSIEPIGVLQILMEQAPTSSVITKTDMYNSIVADTIDSIINKIEYNDRIMNSTYDKMIYMKNPYIRMEPLPESIAIILKSTLYKFVASIYLMKCIRRVNPLLKQPLHNIKKMWSILIRSMYYYLNYSKKTMIGGTKNIIYKCVSVIFGI